MNNALQQALEQNGYHFPAAVQAQFIAFLELLQQWNRVFNLTAIDTPREMVYLHLLDSLSIYPHLHGQRILDVGSGGGLPGIPLAIADPKRSWVLLDKSQKKTRFLTQAAALLGLKNVKIVCGRCENFQSEVCFDSIVSRAFGTINLFLKGTAHLICPEGQFLAMKGVYPAEELRELSPGFEVLSVEKLTIQGLVAERHLVKLRRKPHD